MAAMFVTALGIVWFSPVPQPVAIVMCYAAGWFAALRRAPRPLGYQMAIAGLLLVFVVGAVRLYY